MLKSKTRQVLKVVKKGLQILTEGPLETHARQRGEELRKEYEAALAGGDKNKAEQIMREAKGAEEFYIWVAEPKVEGDYSIFGDKFRKGWGGKTTETEANPSAERKA